MPVWKPNSRAPTFEDMPPLISVAEADEDDDIPDLISDEDLLKLHISRMTIMSIDACYSYKFTAPPAPKTAGLQRGEEYASMDFLLSSQHTWIQTLSINVPCRHQTKLRAKLNFESELQNSNEKNIHRCFPSNEFAIVRDNEICFLFGQVQPAEGERRCEIRQDKVHALSIDERPGGGCTCMMYDSASEVWILPVVFTVQFLTLTKCGCNRPISHGSRLGTGCADDCQARSTTWWNLMGVPSGDVLFETHDCDSAGLNVIPWGQLQLEVI
ncbi:hypothetical protein B0H16DRAFT_1485302 [Mycena metata]|uniref:Uncharacterized protein n=1 Tax=Mycena metata TaxID=1033252 RepID=A0AAD7GHW2_9AGAR|nr:hypothetical protein B0H16DRAFT_1485302 [Mycena metata]